MFTSQCDINIGWQNHKIFDFVKEKNSGFKNNVFIIFVM